MKKAFNTSIFLLVCLVISSSSFAGNKEPFTKTIKREFATKPNGLVTLSNKYGRVDVQTWDKNRVNIEVQILVNAKSEKEATVVFDRIQIDFTDNAQGISAITSLQSQTSSWWDGSSNNNGDFKINYTVFLPRSVQLDVSNKYGDILVAEMDGPMKVDLGYGNFQLNGVNDRANVTLGYGSGMIGFCKALNLDIKYGKINVPVAGDCSIVSKYSKINIAKAGKIDTDSKYDAYTLGDIADFKNVGKYDDIEIGSAQGINIDSKYTNIKANRIHQSINLQLEYGGIYVKNVSKGFGEIYMTGRYTDFKIEIDKDAHYQFQAIGDNSGIKYPAIASVIREVENGKFHEVEGYIGDKSTKSNVKVRLTYGAVKLF